MGFEDYSDSSQSDNISQEEEEDGFDGEDSEFLSRDVLNKRGKRKRSKARNKEDAMMGVFAEEEEGESLGRERRSRNSGVSFVPSQSNLQTRPQSNSEDDEYSSPDRQMPMDHTQDDDEEDILPSFQSGLGSSNPQSSFQMGSQFPTSFGMTSKPTLPGEDKNLPSFLKNKAGSKILKMMEKQGYKKGQGLGPEGKGRVNPIDVKLRGKNMGLGFNNFSEKSKSAVVDERKKKKIVKSDDDILDDFDRLKPSTPKVAVNPYGSMEELISQIEIQLDQPSTPRLSQDIHLLIKLTNIELSEIEDSQVLLTTHRTNLAKEKEGMEKLVGQGSSEQNLLRKLGDISVKLELVSNRFIEQDCPDLLEVKEGFDMLIEVVQSSEDVNQEIVDKIQKVVSELAVATIAPAISKLYPIWDIPSDPTFLVDFFSDYKILFPTSASNPANLDVDFDHHYLPSFKDKVVSPFDNLMFTLFLPKVLDYVRNEWSIHDPDQVIRLVTSYAPLIHPDLFDQLINFGILPLLEKGCFDWNPKLDQVPCHLWIFPWLPIIADQLTPILQMVRKKLSLFLKNWDPLCPSSVEIKHKYILPWKEALSPNSFTKLLSKGILPSLKHMMESQFTIDPSDQNLDALSVVLDWYDILGSELISNILVDTLFPKFHSTLNSWLNSNPPLSHLVQWYRSWKTLLPNQITSNEDIQQQFRLALIALNLHAQSYLEI